MKFVRSIGLRKVGMCITDRLVSVERPTNDFGLLPLRFEILCQKDASASNR